MLSEIELTDEQIKNISGGCAGHPGFGFGHWGYGGHGFGGPYGYSAPYGFGYGYPQVTLVPVQTETVVAQPVTVQTTNCQTVALALV